jgi:hypothetical protein
MTTRTGGCLCGAVRYEVSADPIFQFACHCTDCQRSSGGSPSLGMAFPAPALRVTKGAVRSYESPGDSGQMVVRQFCETCGAPLFSAPSTTAGMIMVKIGSLDDPTGFAPQVDIYRGSARPWHAPVEGAAAFAKGPGS